MSLKWTRIVGRARDISPKAQAVLRYMGDMSDPKGRLFPTHAAIAAALGLCRRTVIRAVAELKAAGWLTSERRWREDGSQTSDLYQLVDLYGVIAARAESRKLPLFSLLEPVGKPVHNPVHKSVENTGLRARQGDRESLYRVTESHSTIIAEPTTKNEPTTKRAREAVDAVAILRKQARGG